MAQKAYIDPSSIQSFWTEEIAPNYFNLDNTNNYKSGIFGYINEVMSTVTLDSFNAMNIARRENYPVSAKKSKSFYTMAAVQSISLPTVTPGSCKAAILISHEEIINNSTYTDGTYICYIDNTTVFMADNIPFMIDYPIKVVSNYVNGSWTRSIHYDTSYTNTLNDSPSKYLSNRIFNSNGTNYLAIYVTLRQVELKQETQPIVKDANINTTTITYEFEGDLANFEAYYYENPGNEGSEIQLKKVLKGGNIPTVPFCYYELINSQKIQLIFPKNSYFTPVANSEIRVDIFTSMGKAGEFPSFAGQISATPQSERYPYNNNMTFVGIINGGCTGAGDIPSMTSYSNDVKKAYATNNTITTSNDLQLYFNDISDDENITVKFNKRRSDFAYRLYGAFCMMKDSAGLVIPTNTLNLSIPVKDTTDYDTDATRVFIKPGMVFEYGANASTSNINYSILKSEDYSLSDDLSVFDTSTDTFLFTNPYLIAVNLNPNIVGYYMNSADETRSIRYTIINDQTVTQFMCKNITVQRNAMLQEDFYKFSAVISCASDLDSATIVTVADTTASDYQIKATKAGTVTSKLFNVDHPVVTITYTDGTTAEIDVGSYVSYDSSTDTATYTAGYTMAYEVYESFSKGDIIATKNCTDLGKVRAIMNFSGLLTENDMYIPMSIESYDADNDAYTIVGYIATDDNLTNTGNVLITHGIYDSDGTPNTDVSLSISSLRPEICVFYNDDTANIAHSYTKFDYVSNLTLTNVYLDDEDDAFALIKQIDFIRSTLTFNPATGVDTDNYTLNIKEIPLVKASWIKDTDNFKMFTNGMYETYTKLQDAFFHLEDNYGIDMKFYNAYGKSRFYKVGSKTTWTTLTNINCSFNFGIMLSSISTQEAFLSSFRSFIKNYIESINDDTASQTIYILNMVAAAKSNFSEIGYIEFYGFNSYSETMQKIEPMNTDEMTATQIANYIPEFLNISTYLKDGENIPSISVDFLE